MGEVPTFIAITLVVLASTHTISFLLCPESAALSFPCGVMLLDHSITASLPVGKYRFKSITYCDSLLGHLYCHALCPVQKPAFLKNGRTKKEKKNTMP